MKPVYDKDSFHPRESIGALIGLARKTMINRIDAKLEPFECGATAIEPVGDRALPVKYYGIAVVFILFDLETVFLYLWALGAQPLTAVALAGFAVFVGLLVLIMVYVWRSGLLEEITR